MEADVGGKPRDDEHSEVVRRDDDDRRRDSQQEGARKAVELALPGQVGARVPDDDDGERRDEDEHGARGEVELHDVVDRRVARHRSRVEAVEDEQRVQRDRQVRQPGGEARHEDRDAQ